jgi:hypothetical protein
MQNPKIFQGRTRFKGRKREKGKSGRKKRGGEGRRRDDEVGRGCGRKGLKETE